MGDKLFPFGMLLMFSVAAIAWLAIVLLWVFFILGKSPTAGWIALFPFGYGALAILIVISVCAFDFCIESARQKMYENPDPTQLNHIERTKTPEGDYFSAEEVEA